MKKTLLLGTIGLMVAGAASAVAPVILTDFYTIAVSPDGNWVVNDGSTGTLIIYDVSTGNASSYEGFWQGNGNFINNLGMAVGSFNDMPAIILNGEVVFPDWVDKYPGSSFKGVTADGSRMCGIVTNVDNVEGYDGRMYLPAYFDITEDGIISDPHYLPCPEKDLAGTTPQYASAVWISDDGKTILGQEVDNSGSMVYPILYTQGDDGEWSYTLPSASLFNPNHIEMPEPLPEFTLIPPSYEDYMTDEEKAAYQAALEEYYASGYTLPYPYFGDFMSEDEANAYNEAAAEYDAAAAAYNNLFTEYFEVFNQIIDQSVLFETNAMTLAADGKTFISAAKKEEEVGEWDIQTVYSNYQFDITTGDFSVIPFGPSHKIIVNQILKDGILFGSTPVSFFGGLPPQTFVYVPGSEGFVALNEYLATKNPSLDQWMKDNLLIDVAVGLDMETWEPIYEETMMSGHAASSYDLTTISGGVMAYMFENGQFGDSSYASYLFTGVDGSTGIRGAVADASSLAVKALKGGLLLVDGIESDITIHDLAGRAVFSAKGVNGVVETGLGAGIYVVKVGDSSFKVVF